MAKFRISLLTPAGEVILTDYDFNNANVLVASTYDESIVFDTHSANKLTFKMSKFLLLNGQKVLNQFAFQIVHGSKIRLVDKNLRSFNFYITNISYELRSENIIISFDCQSAFSYELTKRNIGYSIENETGSIDFVGALRLDEWARKIKEECRINWQYTPVDIRNEKSLEFGDSYNELRTFSVSNSNAYNALVTLAEAYGMILDVDYNNQSFCFIPSKSIYFKGLYLNPYHNLQQLEISTSSQSMATILTITGLTDIDNNEISLLPDIPQSIINWFATTEWASTGYSPFLYSNFLEALADQEGRDLDESELRFIDQINKVPWLENRIINFDYFRTNGFFSQNEYDKLFNSIYNDLRIINGKRIFYTSQYLTNLSETNSLINNFNNINITNSLAAWEYGIKKTIDSSGIVGTNFERFNNNFPLLESGLTSSKKFINRSTLLTEQINLFDSAHQKFLRNIYLFRKTWEEQYKETGDTTGNYYADNINSTDDSIVIELASIKQKLTSYWNNARSAGKFTNYWIPENWDNISALSSATFTTWFAILKVGSNYVINSFIPKVLEEDLRNVSWQYMNTTVNPDLQPGDEWVKATEIVSGSYTRQEFINNGFVSQTYEIYYDPYVIDVTDQNYYFKIETNNKKYYKIDPANQGNATYRGIYLSLASIDKINLAGIYLTMYRYIRSASEIKSTQYREAQKQNKEFWIELYNNYPAVFLEATYKNELATTPELLYSAAFNKFQELSNPEPEYSITAIDLKNITGIDLYQLELGDQIRIEDNLIEQKPDQLKRLLQQRLFISKIDYTLRSDDNIKITVNPVKYDDVLLERLVKLLVQ